MPERRSPAACSFRAERQRKSIAKGDKTFILVDLKSAQEYEKEHVISAVNIPAYSDPDTSAYNQVDRIVGHFKKLPKDKNVIVYCLAHLV